MKYLVKLYKDLPARKNKEGFPRQWPAEIQPYSEELLAKGGWRVLTDIELRKHKDKYKFEYDQVADRQKEFTEDTERLTKKRSKYPELHEIVEVFAVFFATNKNAFTQAGIDLTPIVPLLTALDGLEKKFKKKRGI